MIIGITGYIGVGKTTAAKFIAEAKITGYNNINNKFKVIDADKLGHELLKQGDVTQNIAAEFGESILDRNLKIDRKKLASIVFSNTDLLQRLNKIVHKQLKQQIRDMIIDMKNKGENAVVDVALLAEFELEELCDIVILIKAGIDKVYDRIISGYEKKQIINIMNNQKMPDKYDYVVENDGNLEAFESKIMQVLSKVMD
ncbi:MAG: dephospho-CoA kinase [Candidatus Woesearchaeota archaeon]